MPPLIQRFSVAMASAASLSASSPAYGQGATEFLSPTQAVQVLTDGRPWSATTADGKRANMTFNKDGTGSFEGPITLSTSWEIKGQEICVNLRIAAAKCLRFRRVAGGLEGYQGPILDLRLSR